MFAVAAPKLQKDLPLHIRHMNRKSLLKTQLFSLALGSI